MINKIVNFLSERQNYAQVTRKIKFHKWKIIIALPIMVTLLAILINLWVFYSVNNKVFRNITKLPENDVALVLGTSRDVIIVTGKQIGRAHV